MSFRSFLQQLGFWTTILSWQEPPLYRTRLRGDTLLRLGLAAGIGCVPMTVLLVLFAINVNPPHPAFALFGFLLGAALAGLVLFNGESTSGGKVRVCQEGITRKRMYLPRIPVHMRSEEASWPYESLSRAILVPGQAIGQHFSVLVLTDERDLELIGVPSRVSLELLVQTLASRGLRVESGSYLPQSFTQPLAWPIAVAAGVLGLVLAIGGLGFYAIKTLDDGLAGGLARAGDQDAQARDEERAVAANFANSPPPPPPVQPAPPKAPQTGIGAPPAFEGNPFGSDQSPVPDLTPSPPVVPGSFFDPFTTAPVAPSPPTRPNDGELVGGKGGFPFRAAGSAGQPVVGFRYAVGSWAGKQALSQLDPLFDQKAAPGASQVLAKEGYAVGGLEVDAADMVHAVRVIFVRQNPDGTLDPGDSYTSQWLGKPAGNPTQKLTSGASPLVGIHGRKGALIDALGLIREQ